MTFTDIKHPTFNIGTLSIKLLLLIRFVTDSLQKFMGSPKFDMYKQTKHNIQQLNS